MQLQHQQLLEKVSLPSIERKNSQQISIQSLKTPNGQEESNEQQKQSHNNITSVLPLPSENYKPKNQSHHSSNPPQPKQRLTTLSPSSRIKFATLPPPPQSKPQSLKTLSPFSHNPNNNQSLHHPPPSPLQPPSTSITLYQEAISKNFQVIDNLLRKLNQIYSHQQQYQTKIDELTQKLKKVSNDNENIHHQFRTSHFMIDKKLNSLMNQYSNIQHDLIVMKRQFLLDGSCALGNNSGYVTGLDMMEEINDIDESYDLNDEENKNGTQGDYQEKNGNERFKEENYKDQQQYEEVRRGMKSHKNNRGQQRGSNRKQKHIMGGNRNRLSPHDRRNGYKISLTSSKSSNHNKASPMNKNDRNKSTWNNMKGLDEQNLGKLLLQQINQSSSSKNTIGQESSDNLPGTNRKATDSSRRHRNEPSEQLGNNHSLLSKEDNYGHQLIEENMNDRNQQSDQSIIEGDNNSTIEFSGLLGSKDLLKNAQFMNKGFGNNGKKISIDTFDLNEIESLKNYISQEFIKKETENQELKKFTIMGIEQTINQKCEKIQSSLEGTINQFKENLLSLTSTSTTADQSSDDNPNSDDTFFRKFHQQLVIHTAKQIQDKYLEGWNVKTSVLENQILKINEEKVDRNDLRMTLKDILEVINDKFNLVMNQCYLKYADKNETKRAILFLEKKINKIVEIEGTTSENGNLNGNSNGNCFCKANNTSSKTNKKCLSCNQYIPICHINNNSINCRPLPQQLHHSALNNEPMFAQKSLNPPSQQPIKESQNNNKPPYSPTSMTSPQSVSKIFTSISPSEGHKFFPQILINHEDNTLKSLIKKFSQNNQPQSQSIHNNNLTESFVVGQEQQSNYLSSKGKKKVIYHSIIQQENQQSQPKLQQKQQQQVSLSIKSNNNNNDQNQNFPQQQEKTQKHQQQYLSVHQQESEQQEHSSSRICPKQNQAATIHNQNDMQKQTHQNNTKQNTKNDPSAIFEQKPFGRYHTSKELFRKKLKKSDSSHLTFLRKQKQQQYIEEQQERINSDMKHDPFAKGDLSVRVWKDKANIVLHSKKQSKVQMVQQHTKNGSTVGNQNSVGCNNRSKSQHK